MKQRWLARLAFLAAFGSVVVLLAGGRGSLAVLAVGILGLAAALAGVWWFLANRGVARWFASALVIGSLVTVLVFYISRGRLLDVVLALLLGGVAGAAGRARRVRSSSAV